ncbi:MAG: GNAT family N-acetyltransferase [Clostridiales bacterium]|nr:GNAT family N-acetyltransferase [Clostridiales bacterium]
MNEQPFEKYLIIFSKRYEEITPLFEKSGLEVHANDKAPDNLITCLEVIDKETSQLIGGAALIFLNGEYVLRAVAVDEKYRGRGIGKILVNSVLNEVDRLGGRRIFLSARIPKFYEKLGFDIVNRDNAPNVSNCLSCKRFQVNCYAEIMKYEW